MKRWTCILSLFLLGFRIFSYDVVLPEEESPAAIFPVGRTDQDVSLYIVGAWEAAVSAGLAVQFIPGTGPVTITSFPDMSTGFAFSQTPDITLSLWYLGKYFFEASLADEFTDSLFLLGYQGAENELLQRITLGNTGTSMDDFGLLSLSDSPSNSLGARLELRGENSYLESILRYDPAEGIVQTYRGMSLIEEATIEPSEYLEGLYYTLPDSDIDSLSIYIETSIGDDEAVLTDTEGRVYREAAAGETWTSPSSGLIYFEEARTGRILVTYDGMTTSDTVLGVPVSTLVESIGSTDYFILDAPGIFSPFEICAYYTVPINLPDDAWRIGIYLTEGSYTPDEDEALSFRYDTEDNTVMLTSGGSLPFSDEYRYPLLDDGISSIYGPDRETNPSMTQKNIYVEVLTPVDTFEIDSEYLLSSVKIYRNGIPEDDFTIDDGGTITFDDDIDDTDTIEIRYRITSTAGTGGDLVFGTGGRFEIKPGLTVTTGLGVVWDILSGSYSTTADDNPGSVLFSGGMEYEKDTLSIDVKAGISVSNPDTTGYLRLKGMEDSGFSVGITSTNIFPASVPDHLDKNDRGALYFRDYKSYTAAGGYTLMDYRWEDYEQDAYETGSRIGPYLVSPVGSEVSGNIMAMNWSFDGTGGWAGAQLRLPAGEEGLDLSSYRGISFKLMGEDIASDTEILIQIGSIGEDLDGDGVLDGESGEMDDGFAFNDSACGQVLKIGLGRNGLGNGTVETEDADGDGRMDVQDPALITPEDPPDPADPLKADYFLNTSKLSDGNWPRARIFFTDDDRKRLTNCSAIRIIVTSSDGSANTGTLYIGEVRIEGSTFVSSDAGVSMAEVDEDYLTDAPIPSDTLENYYTEVDRIFHSDDSDQEVLDLRWDETDENITISSPVTPVAVDRYGKLALYFAPLKIQDAADTIVTISLTDSAGLGMSCSFTPEVDSDWHKLEIDMKNLTAAIDGEDIEAEVTVDDTDGLLTLLSISVTGSPAGRILIDEISLTDPETSLAAGVEAEIRWSADGPVISSGGTAILSDVSLYQYMSGSTASFMEGFDSAHSSSGIVSYTELGASILTVGLSSELEVLYDEDGLSMEGGHAVSIPLGKAGTLEDEYHHPGPSGDMERGTLLRLAFPRILDFDLEESAYQVSGDLVQEWSAGIRSSPPGSFTASLAAELKQITGSYLLPSKDYFSGWISSYLFYVPTDTSSNGERTGSISADASIEGPTADLVFHPEFGYIHDEAEYLQENNGLFHISLPIRLGDSPLNRLLLETSYEREISFDLEDVSSSAFSTDLAALHTGFQGQNYFFRNIPFYEIFSFTPDEGFGSAGTENLSSCEYTPLLSVALLRRYGSFLRDLFLPSSADISFSREMERELETWSDSFVTEFSITATAMNLFGRIGAYPRFSWFETDEYSSSFTFSHGYPVYNAEETLEFVYQGYLALDMKGAKVTGEQRLDISVSDAEMDCYSAAVEYSRQKPLNKPLRLPFITDNIAKDMYLEHNERLEGWWERDEEEDAADWSVYGRHDTSLILPLFGSFGIYCRLGFKPEIITSGSEKITTLLAAIQIGAEGNIRY